MKWLRWKRFQKTYASHAVWALALVVLAAIVTHAYWGERFPYTHDGENHLARFANYAAALKEGQFPPRFAPYVFSNFGFPVFQYNYPLANILSVPFFFLKLNPERIYALLQFGFLFAGAVAWSVWLRSRGFKHTAWWGVGQYLLSSYLINTVFFRGNIGEIAVYGLFPVLLVLIDKHVEKKAWSWWSAALTIVLAAFFGAHNIFSVFLSPFFLAYHALARRRAQWSDALVWVLAGAMMVWFWFPAVFELGLVVLQGDSLATQAADHLLRLPQIFNVGTWGFGFSRTLPMDSLQLGFGWLASVQIFLLVAWLIASLRDGLWKRWKALSPEMTLFAVAAAGAVFLSWSGSRWLWENVPGLSLVQFPWRWLFLATLALIPWTTRLFAHSPKLIRFGLIIGVLFLVRTVIFLKPADSFHKESVSYLSFPGTTLTRDENRPKTFTLTALPDWAPTAQILEGEGTVTVQEWRGSRRMYQVQANTDVVVVEPTVYFPGWQTRVNNQPVEQVFTEQSGGRVAYRVQSGPQPYQVETVFRQRTPLRLVSELTSLAAVLTWFGSMIWLWRKGKR